MIKPPHWVTYPGPLLFTLSWTCNNKPQYKSQIFCMVTKTTVNSFYYIQLFNFLFTGMLHNNSSILVAKEKLSHTADSPQQFTLKTHAAWSDHKFSHNYKMALTYWQNCAARSRKGAEHKENSCKASEGKTCTTRGSGFAINIYACYRW